MTRKVAELEKEIIALYLSGKNQVAVGKHFKVSTHAVHKLTKGMRPPGRVQPQTRPGIRPGYTRAMRDKKRNRKIKDDYSDGVLLRTLAQDHKLRMKQIKWIVRKVDRRVNRLLYLTPLQVDVWTMVHAGMRPKEIIAYLGCTASTYRKARRKYAPQRYRRKATRYPR